MLYHPVTYDSPSSRLELFIDGDDDVAAMVFLGGDNGRRLAVFIRTMMDEPHHKPGMVARLLRRYRGWEVHVQGLAQPIHGKFDFNVGWVDLDDEALRLLRATTTAIAVVLVTTAGERRTTRPLPESDLQAWWKKNPRTPGTGAYL